MISGTGFKNKIIEALAIEKPVVSNPMGVEALDRRIQKHIAVGNNSKEIADITIKLIQNKSLRQKITKGIRSKLMEVYNWELISLNLDYLLNEIFE